MQLKPSNIKTEVQSLAEQQFKLQQQQQQQ